MDHNLTLKKIDDNKLWTCGDCDCVFSKSYWWLNCMKSKQEPECGPDNLDWERQAEKVDLPWN